MRTLLIATLALFLAACSSTGGGSQQRGPYGGSVQQQPVATYKAEFGQARHRSGTSIQINNCQPHSSI